MSTASEGQPSEGMTSGQGADDDLRSRRDPGDLSLLLADIAQGDRAAFRTLYELTSARLFALVKRIMGNHASAEEVLQEVYLRIWDRASSYEAATGPALPWLVTIARNRAIDAVRQRGERLAALTHKDGEELLRQLIAPPDGLELAERDELKRCLAGLDEEQCRCIVLAYCDGYSREELAVRFDRSANAIKIWLHRGLAALRRCLEAA